MYMAGSKANSQDPALTELHALNALKSRRPPRASLVGSVRWDGQGPGTQATTMTSVNPSSNPGAHVHKFYSLSEIQFPKTFRNF